MTGRRWAWCGMLIGLLWVGLAWAQPTQPQLDQFSADALLAAGKFNEAEQALLALITTWRAGGPDDPVIQSSLDKLAEIALHHNPEGIDSDWQRDVLAKLGKALGPDDPILSVPLQRIAEAALAADAFDEAETIFTRAQGLRERAFGADDPRAINALSRWGGGLRARRRFTQAADYLRQAQARAERVQAAAPECLVYALYPQAHLAFNQGYFTRAIALLEATRAAAEVSPLRDQYVPACESGLGSACLAQRRFDRAEAHYRRALAMYRELGPEWEVQVAATWRALALVSQGREDFTGAEKSCWRALEIERRLGATLSQAETLLRLGALYLSWGRYTEAARCSRLANDAYTLSCSLDQPSDYRALGALADFRLGRYREARALFTAYLTDAEQAFGAHPYYALALLDDAGLQLAQAQYPAAEAAARRALDLLVRAPEPQPEWLATGHLLRARILLAQGRLAEAQAAVAQVRQALAQCGGSVTLAMAASDVVEGQLDQRLGHSALAEMLLKRALRVQQARLGVRNPIPAGTQAQLGRLYLELGRRAEAEKLLAQAESLQRQTLGAKHPDLAFTLRARGEAAVQPGDAELYLTAAFDILLPVLGAAHPETIRTAELLAANLRAHNRPYDADAVKDRLREGTVEEPAPE